MKLRRLVQYYYAYMAEDPANCTFPRERLAVHDLITIAFIGTLAMFALVNFKTMPMLACAALAVNVPDPGLKRLCVEEPNMEFIVYVAEYA